MHTCMHVFMCFCAHVVFAVVFLVRQIAILMDFHTLVLANVNLL